MYDVFISYSHKDRKYADAICYHLEEGNIKCWYAPRNIPVGDPWAESIIEAIRKSKVFLIIISKNSMVSNQVYKEMNLAKENNLKIITFRITKVRLTDAQNAILNNGHWLDSMNRRLYSSLKELQREVCKVLQYDYRQVKRKLRILESLSESIHNIRAAYINIRRSFKMIIDDFAYIFKDWWLHWILVLFFIIEIGMWLWKVAELLYTKVIYGLWI